nr:hypothetical protein [Tanacetum cinerariifolium]
MIGELTGSKVKIGDSDWTTRGWTSSVLLLLVGCTMSLVASISRSTTGEEVVVGIVGPGYAISLLVVIPFRSSFGLVIVLPRRVFELEDEAAEESRVDEPELGKSELDRLVPAEKISVALWLVGITLVGSRGINILSIANGGRTNGEGMRTTTSFIVWSNCFHLLVNLKTLIRFLLISAISAFSAAISVSEEEVIELDDSLRWAEVSQSLW